MASFRRSMSVVERDGAVQNGEASFDVSSLPKLHLNQSYLTLGRLLNLLSKLLCFPGIVFQRGSRPVERSKPKGLHLKRSFFHFLVCFMLGVLISFTTFLSVDVSSRHQAFSFAEDVVVENAHRNIGSVGKEFLLVAKPLSVQNHSLDTVSKWELKNEALDASHANSSFQDSELVPQKLLIIVTPTHERPFQAHYLNRLAHTLKVVPPPLLWIVVEMSSQSTETAKVLRDTGVMYRHLVCNQNVTSIRYREVHQRNVALSHIEKHHLDGIVHFADDDRMYSVALFDQMRQIRRFGVWPVAILTESKNQVFLEGPVCNGSHVIGWHTNRRSKLSRRFHVDMSGFAFNSTILWDLKRWHRPTLEPIRQHDTANEGYQETTFIEQLVEDESQMEGFPSDCSIVMVWHLHLESPHPYYPNGWFIQKNLEVVAPLT